MNVRGRLGAGSRKGERLKMTARIYTAERGRHSTVEEFMKAATVKTVTREYEAEDSSREFPEMRHGEE